ncbi:MAG: hypothetical protein BGO49_07170 [Planctomycetales bacterium 71-10]|nr:MAG: hypothetical protein BGO49_07170 [Planctomycetales bacterium 71-10]
MLERPGDLEARLAYAEALDAAADPLGEFIRLECRLSDGPRAEGSLRDWDRRHALFDAHQVAWVGRLAEIGAYASLQRGLVTGVEVDLDAYLEHGEEIFGRHPVRSLSIRGVRGRMDELLDSRWIGRVEYLSLHGGDPPDGRGPTDDDVAELAARIGPLDLRGLGLERNKEVGPASVRAVLDAPWAGRLEYLGLGWTSSGDEGAGLLASSDRLGDLRRLDLSASEMSASGLQALASSPTLARLGLTEFETSWNDFGPEDQARCLRSPVMARVERVHLDGRLAGDLVDALTGSETLGALGSIFIANDWGLETAAVRKLANWAGLSRVRSLTFCLTMVTDEQLGILAASPHLADLACFSLSENSITDDGVERLCRSPAWRGLTHLSIDRNTLTERSVRAILGAGWFPGLQALDLHASYDIGDAGAAALANYRGATRLRTLVLSLAGISDVGALRLAEASFVSQLWTLWLLGNEKISPAVGERLQKRLGRRVHLHRPEAGPRRAPPIA